MMSKEKWDRRYAEKERVWPEEPSPVLVEETGELSPGRALDLAAGEGRNALYLAGQGWEVTAVDFSDVAVQKGREFTDRAGLEIEWNVADLNDYRPPEEQFDLVTILYLHMPWEEMAEVIHRAAAAVKHGGVFLLAGHDRSNLGRGAGGPQDPEVLYTADDVAVMLAEFTVEKAHPFERGLEHEGERLNAQTGETTAIDCLVRARKV